MAGAGTSKPIRSLIIVTPSSSVTQAMRYGTGTPLRNKLALYTTP